jgi:predicted dithiol-disulfide oxidoreductase (DUF899 family)
MKADNSPDDQEIDLSGHPVVSESEWLAARKELLAKEKEFTRLRDRLAAQRRELPWVKVTQDYIFEGSDGKLTLTDLFQGKSQLIIQHFMFAPGDTEGCVGCSHSADHVDAARQHFEQKDIAFAAVSRAPLQDFAPFRKRMGWTFNWVSSAGSDFSCDYRVSFTPEEVATGKVDYNYGTSPYAFEDLPGVSVFYKSAKGEIFHTYSTYARGLDPLLGSYQFMDLTPKGRNESGIWRDWLRFHDEYDTAVTASCCGGN